MRLRKIERNSTLAWAPANQDLLLALGTVAGALDASFSSRTELELFDLNLAPSAPLSTTATATATATAATSASASTSAERLSSGSLKKLASVPVNAR
eukprot:jgi/Hompol1/3563/HPOL_006618-RA